MSPSHVTPRAAVRPSAIAGRGQFCTTPIPTGATVAGFAGACIDRGVLEALPSAQRAGCVQIDETLYLWAGPDQVSLNHSCAPNCALSGQVVVVARRPIAVGEELTIDYATCNGSDIDEFECTCGASACRGKITGHDWMLTELQQRYRGQFSPYLARRIEALAAPPATRRAFAY